MPKASTLDREEFSGETFEALAKDLETGRLPLARVSLTDTVQDGLRAMIRKSGHISYHVHYDIGDSRPLLKVGEYPEMSVVEARAVAKTIRTLADSGIDVQAGLHERLIRELKEKGTRWRP